MKHYLELAYQIRDLLNSDERFILLNEKEKAMEEDKEIMSLAYNKEMKEIYLSDMLRHFDKNSPEVKRARLELFHANEKLNAHQKVIEYLEAYKNVEEIIDKINKVLFKDFKGIKCRENCRR